MSDERDVEFTAFVVQHGAALLRTACLLTGDGHHGEDLVQTSLTKAYGAWPRVAAADDAVAYVRRILINSHLSWRRRLMNTERVVRVLPDRGEGDLQSAQADSDEMRAALSCLTPRVRTAVVLRYYDDLSEAETARVMGCSISTVNNHVSRGLSRLRSLLGPGGDPDLTSTTTSATTSRRLP